MSAQARRRVIVRVVKPSLLICLLGFGPAIFPNGSLTAASFTTSTSSYSQTVTQGQSTSFTLTVQSQGGFNQQVDVYGIGMPTGSVSAWSSEHVTPPANSSVNSTLTITTNASTSTGTFSVILRAASRRLRPPGKHPPPPGLN